MATKISDKPCWNCGREFNDECGSGLCTPCELEVRAREPPDILKDMRKVYKGEVQTNQQQAFRRILDTKPSEFMNQLRQLERDYRMAMAKQQPKAKPEKEEEPSNCAERAVDSGGDRIEDLIEGILKGAAM